jgi:hypothetical protein
MDDFPLRARDIVEALRAAERSDRPLLVRSWLPSPAFDELEAALQRSPARDNVDLGALHRHFADQASDAGRDTASSPSPASLARRLARRARRVGAPESEAMLAHTTRALDALAHRLDELAEDQRLLVEIVRAELLGLAAHEDARLDDHLDAS